MIKMHEKMKMVSVAIALMAVLSMTGTGWAKKSFAGPGVAGALDSTRTIVTVATITVPAILNCDPANLNQAYSIRAFILQPSGRIFAMGSSDPVSFTCSASAETNLQNVEITAFKGLEFKPGPATLLYKIILSTDDGDLTTPTIDTVLDEYGFRVDLH